MLCTIKGKKMSKFLYADLAVNLSKKIKGRLDDISVDYNFDFGDEFEIAICEILRSFLPNKFGICRGFVVNKEGNKAGDDIIIYDQERFPTLKQLSNDDLSRKENIPIEAVYCYIEAKYTLDISNSSESNLQKAIKQVRDVKELVNQRSKYELDKNDPYHISHISKNKVSLPDGIPPFRNPIFALIISRYVSYGNKKLEDNVEISKLLKKFIKDSNINSNYPEGIVAGDNHYITTSIKRVLNHPTNFIIPNDQNQYLEIYKEELALSMGFIHLYSAVDWIRLDKMPWDEIFNNLKNN